MANQKNNSKPSNPQENQYTPGPWKARDYKTKNGGIWVDCHSFANKGKGRLRGGTVCEVLDQGAEIQEANVHLIVAAPDLLAALEKLCPLTHRADCKGLRSRYAIAQEENCTCGAAGARAAIAKAKGVPHE